VSEERATVRLLSIGTAQPPGVLGRERALELALSLRHPRASEALIRRLHERSGVGERRVAIIEGDELVLFGPGERANPRTSQRLAVYQRAAPGLAVEASDRALRRAGVDGTLVTHVVTASCTGASAPGLDRRLIEGLGLRADVRRTHVGFMGCHAAVNALAVAAALARSEGGVVLVCCAELCSVHMHHSARPDKLVANALFADGAAAGVIACDAGEPLVRGPRLRLVASRVIPGSEGLMGWEVGDHGFEMTLDASVPAVLAEHVPAWMGQVLAGAGLSVDEVSAWAIHPGGPKVVSELAAALGLRAGATDESVGVLARCGNMSSATVLFILARLLGWGDEDVRVPWAGDGPRDGPGVSWRTIVAAAFGPGLAGEMLLLDQA
jgi:predicted naringenin-chalcone synthase